MNGVQTDIGKTSGLIDKVKEKGIGGVIGKTLVTGLQTVTTSVATSAINAFNIQYDEYGNALGLGWSNDAFNAGVQGGLISAATSMTSTFTSGVLNVTNATEKLMMGFSSANVGDIMGLNGFLGSMAGQAMNYALIGSASFNALNFSMFGLKDSVGGTIGGGLLELNFGKNGFSSRIGMGGADVSMGTMLKSLKGLEAWGVNLTMLTSGQEEAKKYASALRTLYSAGLDAKGNKTKEFSLFEEILAGKTNVVEDPNAEYNAETTLDETTGIKTITLGKEALENGARFGLNILLGHEAYRNGIKDGKQGQRIETNNAVIGHINIAARLGMTYGMDSLSDNDRTEIDALQKAAKGDISAIAKILGSYDASADFWKLMRNGELKYDGKATLTDEDGNVLMTYQQMGVKSENIIEGSLAFLLTGKNDAAGAALARQYMLEAEMEHTNNGKPVDEWRWKDGEEGAITEANKKKGINLFDRLDTIGTTMVAPLFAGLFDYQTDLQASYLLRGLDPTKDLDDQEGIYDAMKALYGTGPAKPIFGGIAQLSLGANKALSERFDNLLDAKVGFYFGRTAFLRDGTVSEGRDVRLSTDFGSRHPGKYTSTNDIHVGGDYVFKNPGAISGQSVLLPFNGKVLDNFWSDKGGNIVKVEYGFQFEGSFISQHLFGQSMHLKNEGVLAEGTFYDAGTALGNVGNSGRNTSGYHLHQEFFINNKVDSREEQLKYDLMFGNWNKGIFEGNIFSRSNSSLNLNFGGNVNDNRTYFNTVRYLEMIYGRTLVWQTGGAR